MDGRIDKVGSLMNTNTQEFRSVPDCFIDKNGELLIFNHTHSPDGRSPHLDKDHPGIWNDLLQDRHYIHGHPHSNCRTSVSTPDVEVGDKGVWDLDASVEMPTCDWSMGGDCIVA